MDREITRQRKEARALLREARGAFAARRGREAVRLAHLGCSLAATALHLATGLGVFDGASAPAGRRGLSLALFYHQLGQLRQRIEADPATRLNIEEVANWLRRAEWFWEKTGELCRTGGGAADRGSSFERRGPI